MCMHIATPFGVHVACCFGATTDLHLTSIRITPNNRSSPPIQPTLRYVIQLPLDLMATKSLTTDAIALTEKKMDMTLDDIIKMTKTNVSKPKQLRVLGAFAKKRSNFQGNQFPYATEADLKASVAPISNRCFNRGRGFHVNRMRVAGRVVERKTTYGNFTVKMATKSLTTEAIALKEKKMDMTLGFSCAHNLNVFQLRMASNAYSDPIGQLVLALLLPVQGSKGLSECSSSSVSLPNDVSYENMSDYVARISHLNPNLVSGNMGSPIFNNSTNSGPNVEASSLLTDATSLMSDGAGINIGSYQNLPSSPLSFSSSNISALAIEGASPSQMTTSNLNQINHVTRRRGRQHSDMPSLFTDKERELLEYLPQISKKPRIDAYDNALHQHFIQHPLQKQELLLLHDYNHQPKTLLQQHNLQKMKQKQRLQSIPQYVRAPTQQQMRDYLKQMANRSVPALYPSPSGICSRRLMQFIYHLQQCPSDNAITYWRKCVAKYYALRVKKRWCLSLYNGIGERALGVSSQSSMEAWHCDMCGSKSGKGFEVNFEILSRLVKTYFEAWEFCSRCHDEVVPHSLVAPQVNELVQAAEKCPPKGRSIGVAVPNLQSACKIFVAAEGQLMKTLDSLLVNDLGFPKRYIRCLQRAEIINSMKDLMTFSLDNVGPIESVAKYSQGPTTSKKQAGTSTTCEAVVRGWIWGNELSPKFATS